jgi:hypothetical protein
MKNDTLGRVVWAIGTALVCLLFIMAGKALPAPLPHKETPTPRVLQEHQLVGEWTMTWAGCPWITSLKADHDYRATAWGVSYIGSWWVQNGYLYIWEAAECVQDGVIIDPDPENYIKYKIDLSAIALKGMITRTHETDVLIPWCEVSFKRRPLLKLEDMKMPREK